MGQTVANLTPHVSATSHHGQGDGTGHPFSWRLHWGAEDIDEVVAMGPVAYWALSDAYRANDGPTFTAVFNAWMGANASPAAYALASDFRTAFWAYLP